LYLLHKLKYMMKCLIGYLKKNVSLNVVDEMRREE
jgi:hypothetical protein